MKKATIVAMAMIICIIFTQSAFAGSCSDRGCTSRVKMMYTAPYSEGKVSIELKDVNPASANCNPASDIYYTLYKDNIMFDKIFDQISAAAIMGNEVFFRIVEGSDDCEIIYVKVWY